jgi:4-hydroxy-3-methylbut-2-enyl diphosphate reductase
MVVFSAHGVAPSVHANAKTRRLRTIDATCPLVTKVHVEARKFAAEGYTIVLIGQRATRRSGTTGGPGADRLGRTESDVDTLEVDDPDRIAYIADHALGRRDQLDHRRAERQVPERGRARPTTSVTRPRTARWR